MSDNPEVLVTNYNRNFTGVSATIAALFPEQSKTYDMALVGQPLPGAPQPIAKAAARALSRTPPKDRPFTIWHVRRDPEMIAGIWARDVLRLPIKLVFTSAAKHRHSAFPRWLISRMDRIIATSEEAATFFPNVAKIAPHGVDTNRYQPSPDRSVAWAKLGYGGQEGVAIIGRIRPEKGTDIFVDAMIKVMAENSQVTGLVIGMAKSEDQAFLDEQKAKVAAAGLEKRILFPGFISHGAQTALMPALSLVANVSRYEPFGVVPIEGLAAGTPFVCSDTGYYREFSAGETTGLITEPGDVDSAANAISALLGDKPRLEAMAVAGRALALERYSVVREARDIASVYEDLWANG